MTACSSYKFHHILHSSDHTCMRATPLQGPKFVSLWPRAPTLAPCHTWKYMHQAASRTCVYLVLIAANTRAGTVTAKLLIALPRTRCQLNAGARVNALLCVLSVSGLPKCVTTAVVYTHASRFQRVLLLRIRFRRTINERPMSWNSQFSSVQSCFDRCSAKRKRDPMVAIYHVIIVQ